MHQPLPLLKRQAKVWVLLGCLLFLSAGCGSYNKEKIVGRWVARSFTGVSKKKMRRIYAVLIFRRDGTMMWEIPTPKGRRRYTGRYTLGMGPYVTLYLDKEFAGRKVHTEHVTITGDTLVMSDSDGTKGTFHRSPLGVRR